MHESTTITADGHVLTWREYVDEQMARDADADAGIPFAVAECPPVATYKSIITRGLARVAALLVVALVPLAFMMHGTPADADTGAPVYRSDVTYEQWECLTAHGWQGDPTDGSESVLYSPDDPRNTHVPLQVNDCPADTGTPGFADQQATAEDGSHVPADYYDHVDLTPLAPGEVPPELAPCADALRNPTDAMCAAYESERLGYGARHIIAAKSALAAGMDSLAYTRTAAAYQHMTSADYTKAYSRAPDALQHIMWRVAQRGQAARVQ